MGNPCVRVLPRTSEQTRRIGLADDIRNPAKLGAARADETCLTCHLNQPTHIGRIQSGHARSRVSCLSCHRMHKPETENLVTRKPASINQQCSSCHLSAWSQFQRPHAHRLAQGAMSCTDCHNPHGSFFLRQVQTFSANEPGCFKCHSDKRRSFYIRARADAAGRMFQLS